MKFSDAIKAVMDGSNIRRSSWKPNVFIFKVNGSEFEVNREPLKSILGNGTHVKYNPHLDIHLEDKSISVWTPTQIDMFADDWVLAARCFKK